MPASPATSAIFGPTPSRAWMDTLRAEGRSQWTGAARSCALVSLETPAKDFTERLLGGEQPPPAWLAAFVSLDLDPVRNVGVELAERDRRAVAGDHGDDLRALRPPLDRRRQGRAGATPSDDFVADEADRIPLSEALLFVVARSWGDSSRGDGLQHRLQALGVLLDRRGGIKLDQGKQARLLGGRPDDPGGLLRELA